VRGPLERLLDAYGSNHEVLGLGLAQALGVLLLGAVLGLLGAWASVQRHLRQFQLGEGPG